MTLSVAISIFVDIAEKIPWFVIPARHLRFPLSSFLTLLLVY